MRVCVCVCTVYENKLLHCQCVGARACLRFWVQIREAMFDLSTRVFCCCFVLCGLQDHKQTFSCQRRPVKINPRLQPEEQAHEDTQNRWRTLAKPHRCHYFHPTFISALTQIVCYLWILHEKPSELLFFPSSSSQCWMSSSSRLSPGNRLTFQIRANASQKHEKAGLKGSDQADQVCLSCEQTCVIQLA